MPAPYRSGGYKPHSAPTGPERRRGVTAQQAAARQATIDYRRHARMSRPVAPLVPETKYFDTSFQQSISSAADWTGSEVPCTNYIQSDGTTVGAYTDSALIPSAVGAGYGQITGNKYALRKLRVRGELTGNVSADQADVPTATTVRVVLVEDTQPQGAQAQGETIFTDMGGAVQCQFSFLAMAAGAGGRFRILKDKVYTLNPAVAGTDGASTNSVARNSTTFKFNINFPKTEVILKANSSTPTVASLSNRNYFLLAHCSVAGPTTNINGCARAYYQD